jgi:succinate dehydrogenase / fumarate reductase cytochrome b subunit
MALSSISKKLFLALAGLALCGFAALHLAGNFALYAGGDMYNKYGDMLRNSPMLIPGEVVLASFFLAHIALAIWVTLDNKAARKYGNAENVKAGESTVASSTMIYSGLIVIAFLILHLIAFRFPDHPVDAVGRADLRKVVIEYLSQPAALVWYLVAVSVLGLHLRHALQSSLRTLGIFSAGRWNYVDGISIAFGLLIAAGYASIPIWVYFGRPIV